MNPPVKDLAGEPVDRRPESRLSDPEQWVDQYGDFLFRYAMLQVREASRAEDLVQDTFHAALKNPDAFQGKSSEKSWFIGILRNKIHEQVRRAGREVCLAEPEFYQEEENASFVSNGFHRGAWKEENRPAQWTLPPESALDREVFWKTFQGCAGKLPRNVAQVFLLRELEELDSKAICDLMNISENHLGVMLHRARMALRRCLEKNWFARHDKPDDSPRKTNKC